MLNGLPVDWTKWLDNGQIRAWNGPMREIYSPLLVRDATGLTQKIIGRAPLMNRNTSINVLDHAREAFSEGNGEWPSMHVEKRTERLEAFLSRIAGIKDNIVRLLQWEIGKSGKDARQEFDRTINYARGILRSLKERNGVNPGVLIKGGGITGRIKRVPSGITLIMGPFNYPFFETMAALIPALLTGNIVIFKPPRLGCLLFQPMMEIFSDIFPSGSVNIIQGEGKEIVPPILSSGLIDVFYFIGTSAVATCLRGLHPRPHRLKCILGMEAKNPAIVLPDADLEEAVRECVDGALTFNGQRCAALKIFFVHRSVAGEFNERLSSAVSAVRCGMPWEEDVFITPLAEINRVEYLKELIGDAFNLGASVINEGGGDSCGSFFYPAILYPAKTEMRVCSEEQFGPLMPVIQYESIDEPLRYISGSNYGQQASIFGRDKKVLTELAGFLTHHVSRININCKCQRSPDMAPFTGRKDSAEGDLSISEALNTFTVPVFIAAKNGNTGIDIVDGVKE